MSNPLRHLQPIDCSPAVFQAACDALGFGDQNDRTTTSIDGPTLWRWVKAGNDGVTVHPSVLTDTEWTVLLNGREIRRAMTLGPAIDCALRLVAERTAQ